MKSFIFNPSSTHSHPPSRRGSALLVLACTLGLGGYGHAQTPFASTSLHLDGVEDHVQVPYSPTFPTEVLTVSAWIKAEPSTGGVIISRGEDATNDHSTWHLALGGGTGLFKVYLENGYGRTYYSNSVVVDGSWHHVAATRDSAATLVLYVDGVADATFSNTRTPYANNSQTLTIGCAIGSVGPPVPYLPTAFMTGGIDEVAMWNRVLTGAEVLNAYRSGIDAASPGLQGYWSFDEGTGQQILDSSPAANHGYRGSDGVLEDSADPVWTDSIVSRFVCMDGVDDHVRVPYSPTFPSEVFTVSAWVKAAPSTGGSLVSRSEDDLNDHDTWALGLKRATGKFRVYLENGSGRHYDSNALVVDGSWHHVAASRDASGVLVLYVDGVADATFSNTITPYANNSQMLTIGCTIGSIGPPPQTPRGFITGGIDEVAMWNRALTDAEVLSVHRTGVDAASPGLQGYWNFDEGSGQQVLDASPAGNHGYRGSDGVHEDPADPTWASGGATLVFGSGWPGAGGITPSMSANGCAVLGSTLTLNIAQGEGGSPAALLIAFGTGGTTLPNGCTIDVSLNGNLLVPLGNLSGGGPGNGSISIPATLNASGTVFLQALILDSTAGMVTTNALKVVILP